MRDSERGRYAKRNIHPDKVKIEDLRLTLSTLSLGGCQKLSPWIDSFGEGTVECFHQFAGERKPSQSGRDEETSREAGYRRFLLEGIGDQITADSIVQARHQAASTWPVQRVLTVMIQGSKGCHLVTWNPANATNSRRNTVDERL